MKTPQVGYASIGILCCCLLTPQNSRANTIAGENFIVKSGQDFSLSKPGRAEDFNLYDIKLHGKVVANLYEGDHPDFPYSRAVDEPSLIARKTTLLSTPLVRDGNGYKRDHLVQFTDCDGFCAIHVWYVGATPNEAQRIDKFVRAIRRKK